MSPQEFFAPLQCIMIPMKEDVFHWLGLSLTPGVGSTLIKRLLERFDTPERVFRAPEKELLAIDGLGERVAKEIRKGPSPDQVNRELSLARQAGARIITLEDSEYPRRLKEIYDPPPILYVRGEIKDSDGLAVAIVGSRRTTPYGRWITEKIAQELAGYRVTIVSGLARGIDSLAHWAALSAGERTLAVLGCGVDIVYPRENRALFQKITEQGAVISEFPMGCAPEAGHFPKRNRVISGLSMGVVVIEAGEKSGSLITAGYALEQGREVFAVPGNVGSAGSRGTNQLIKQGAKVVLSSEDILEEILPQWGKETKNEPEKPERNLSEEEMGIYNLLGQMPLHIDAIIRESGLEPGKVSSLLLNLELKGLIAQWPGKCFTQKM